MDKLQVAEFKHKEAQSDGPHGRRITPDDRAGYAEEPFPETGAEGSQTGSEPTHLRDLLPDPQNRRRHNPRNVGLIVESLQHVGAARSVVIDEHNVILAGNATIDAAAEAGIEHVRVVEASGHEIIAVRRRGLTDAQKRHLVLADNRTAELATWDVAQLRADVDAGLDLGAFFQSAELADLLGGGAPVPEFQEASDGEQGRLDQLEAIGCCPHCGGEISREDLK